MSVVLTDLSDRILTVTVNRPEKLKALNAEVLIDAVNRGSELPFGVAAFLEKRPARFTGN